MSPVEQAKILHESEAGPRSFREDLEAHLLHGLVYSTPTAFIMARYVRRDWPDEVIVDPWCNPETDLTCAPDCVHVYLAAGDISQFLTFEHKPCAWVSFERRCRLRFYPYPSIQCKLTDLTSRPISSEPTEN